MQAPSLEIRLSVRLDGTSLKGPKLVANVHMEQRHAWLSRFTIWKALIDEDFLFHLRLRL